MKKCLIIANTYKAGAVSLGAKMKDYLKAYGVEASIVLLCGTSSDCSFGGNDFVITLGGDGTVLFAARSCANLKIPIFSVNLGTFGFLASIQKEHWEKGLVDYLQGAMSIEVRSMIKAALYRNGKAYRELWGLNEVVIGSKYLAQMAKLSVEYNGIPLGTFDCDGIIVSTATGSTAYSLASGGPIVDPYMDAIVLTLINPFSLSSRPLVVSALGSLRVAILPSRESKIILTVDGQAPLELCSGDYIQIALAKDKALLVGATRERFYKALRDKLKWAGGQGA